MVKKEIKSIILYLDSAAAIDYLTDEQAGILFKAVLRYGRDGQMLESSDTALTALFTMLCTQIDRDHKKYEERCERNVTNAKKRYEKQHQDEQPPAIACDRMPPHPNACHNDNNSDNDTETDNKTDTESVLLDSLKIVESLGSFLIRIQEIKYDERETYWVAETDEDRAIIDKLPKSKWSLDKDNSIIEISEIDIERLRCLCSTIPEDLYAFEFLREGSVSFRNGYFYIAFINYFMLLEEAFAKDSFKTKEIEANFWNSDILYLCVLTALDLLCRNQFDKLYVDWMQTEVNKHNREWNYEGVIHTIIRFRGDYLHSNRRTQILGQRDQFFKYIAAFAQRICFAYCCYLIKTSDIEQDEMNRYVDDEIERLKGLLAK